MKVIDILFAAPIPRGHQVEVTWYAKMVTGLLSGKRLQEFPYHPVVRDLDTGIVYGSFDFFWRNFISITLRLIKGIMRHRT